MGGEDIRLNKSREYNRGFLRTIYATGSLSMLVMAIYTVISHLGIGGEMMVSRVYFYNINLDWLAVIFFLGVGALEYFANFKQRKGIILIFLLRYLSLFIFMNFISAEQNIALILWMIIFITTGLTFGIKYMAAGQIFMVTTMCIGWFIEPVATESMIFNDIITSILIISTASVTVWLRQVGVIQVDVYEQLQTSAKVNQQRLETIINSITDALLNVDKKGKINFYNSATLSLIDTNKNLAGKSIDSILNLTDENAKKVSLVKILNKTERNLSRQDLIHTYPDGEKINLFIEISPVRKVFGSGNSDATDTGMILVIRDITKQKSLDEERDEFISVVSHELRTPVAIAEGSLSNLQLLIEKKASPKLFSSTLNAAHDQILYLGKMVNDLSTLSRAQRGVYMDPEEIDVREFTDDLYKKYITEANERKLDLNLDIHAHGKVKVSRMAIEEIMQNLITNSLKYTNEGSVTIGAHLCDGKSDAKDKKQMVEFFVKDTGIGISIPDQKHVYDRFWRSEDYRTRETGGTGLGLHIVQQLARKINTRLDLKSRIDHGSTFSFILPITTDSDEK